MRAGLRDSNDSIYDCDKARGADTACVRGRAAHFNRFLALLKNTKGLENCVPQIFEDQHYHIVNFDGGLLSPFAPELERLARDCNVEIAWIV